MITKMRKTPTGWGEGYSGAEVVICKKLSPEERPTVTQYMRCQLDARDSKPINLFGADVKFKNIDLLHFDGLSVHASNDKLSPIACYVDSGFITCYKEK